MEFIVVFLDLIKIILSCAIHCIALHLECILAFRMVTYNGICLFLNLAALNNIQLI